MRMEKNRIELTDSTLNHDVLDRLYSFYYLNPPSSGLTIDTIIVLMDLRRFEQNKKRWEPEAGVYIDLFDRRPDSVDYQLLKVRHRGTPFWFITSRIYRDDTVQAYPVWRYEGR